MEDFGIEKPKSVWEQDPSLKKKSVINLRTLKTNERKSYWSYWDNPDDEVNWFKSWGFVSTKMRTDDYEAILDFGWQRSGTFFYRPDIKNSWWPLYTPRLDITEFKLSKTQKKHMKRFNQYMNGEREFVFDKKNEIVIKPVEEIKKEKSEKEFEEFIKNLQKEKKELKGLIINAVFGHDSLFESMLEQGKAEEVKQEIEVIDSTFQPQDSNNAFYEWNLADLILKKMDPSMSYGFSPSELDSGMEKRELIANLHIFFNADENLQKKYKVHSDPVHVDKLMFKSTSYISIPRAKVILFEDEEEKEINDFNEIKYHETGDEKQIAIEAGNSRPYTDFFDEFVPNKMEESKRKHKYTVSIHKAICYSENLEVFQKFDKSRFNKDRLQKDFEGFLTNSPLFDPNDPILENVQTFKDDDRIDGLRTFKDEGVYPEYHGSYHFHHRIDGKLVAINVWDITENTLGCIYTFYDPAYSFLSLGNVTAVREIEYMKKIKEKYNPNMRYYYMGYYVHNCQKSVYKEHMHPQHLLCPITYTYVPLTPELKEEIQKYKFLQLNKDAEESNHASMGKLTMVLKDFKFVYERERWLHLFEVRKEMMVEMRDKLISVHQIMGDIFFDLFLFEYQ